MSHSPLESFSPDIYRSIVCVIGYLMLLCIPIRYPVRLMPFLVLNQDAAHQRRALNTLPSLSAPWQSGP